jgi:hypothetical protein
MRDLQEATEKICELKGENMALLALLACVIRALPLDRRTVLPASFSEEIELARTVLLNSESGDHVLAGFETLTGAIETLLAAK